MDKIELKNGQLPVLFKVMNFPLPFKLGRVRSRFLALIKPTIDLNDQSRLEMCGDFSIKDKEGNPMIGPDRQYVIDPKRFGKFSEEVKTMMDENFVLDMLPSLKSDLPAVQEIIDQSPIMLDDAETVMLEAALNAMIKETTTKPKKKNK